MSRLIFFLICLCSVSLQQDPTELAQRISNAIFENQSSFLVWDYGGGIITDGLWQFVDQFKLQLVERLNVFLNSLEQVPSQFGYKVLHNTVIPWGHAVGDDIGLFPIAFLKRAKYYTENPNRGYSNVSDLIIAETVAKKYIYPWPKTLPDGTFSRAYGWPGEKGGNNTFLWCDDHYMGMTLLSRLAVLDHDEEYAARVGKMQLTYAERMLDKNDNVYWHGFNVYDNHHSCCKWGRANGWVMMSHVEVLQALVAFPGNAYYKPVSELFARHAEGVAALQSADGRWHQVLGNSSTFLETSASAMFLWSFIQGVQKGWLDRSKFVPIIERGWRGLVKTIQSDGVVTGICAGTGVGLNDEWYNQRPTAYLQSRPGLGAVLLAVSAWQEFTSFPINAV